MLAFLKTFHRLMALMMRRAAILVFPLALLCLVSAPVFAAGNYAECILEKIPGVQNDAVAGAIARTCLAEHPGGINAVEQGSGRSEWFGYNSGNECVIKKGEKVASRIGGNLLTGACNKLYDPVQPGLFDDLIPKKR